MKKKIGILVLMVAMICCFTANIFAAPANPVTSVQVTQTKITNGNLYVTVKVIGYGSQNATYDGRSLSNYTTRSYNSPWNTKTVTKNITVN